MSVRLQREPFDAGALLNAFSAARAQTGAVVSFTGLARASTDGGAVSTLELEAYPGFTEKVMAELAETARRRFAVQDLLIVHRHGPISPGEPIVLVATAAEHRRAAFEAADYLMDQLKTHAPFWKKEHGPLGSRWIEPRPEDRHDARRWSPPQGVCP